MFNLDDELNLLRQQHNQVGYTAPNLQGAVQAPYSNENDFSTLLGAGAIGAGNMLNNTVFGGLGQFLGTLGAGVEYVSPFSGNQDNKVLELMRAGVPYDTATQIFPNRDSWLTSLGKGSLEIQNAIAEPLANARQQLLGDNPTLAAQIAEGTGSSLGFLLAGLGGKALAGGSNLAGAIAAGATEALSESGGTLGEAYRQGMYDNGGLAAANKSFAANVALNSILDTTLGRFAPYTEKIRNPITRFAAQTGGQVINELLQEPSQQVIEKASERNIYSNENFLPALVKSTFGDENGQNWWTAAKQVAPSVVGSTLLTQALLGGAGLANPTVRQKLAQQFRNRNVNPEVASRRLKAELDTRQRLLNQLQRERQTVNDEGKVYDIKRSIEKVDRRIHKLRESLLPETLDYTPNPYDEFSGKKSVVTTNAGQNQYDTFFTLVDADDLVTSHNDNFSKNENYPQDWQIRQRENEASKNEVERIAASLDPLALADNYNAQNGAPIIAKGNTVLSGNGRVLAIRRAYSHHQDKAHAYRQFVIDHAHEFGVDPDLAARMKHPVLVRLLHSEADLSTFAAEANSDTIQKLSAGELANNDAQKITKNNLLQDLEPGTSIDKQPGILEAFAASLPANEQNDLRTTSGFSQRLVERFRNALISIAYGNNDIINKLTQITPADDLSRNISNALRTLAPDFALIQEQGKSHLNLGNDIAAAVGTLDTYRRNTKHQTVQSQADQPNLPTLELSDEAELLLRFFHHYRNNPNLILQGLANYTQYAQAQARQGEATLFGDEGQVNASKITLLEHALGSTLDNARNWDFSQTPQAQDTQNASENLQGGKLIYNRPVNNPSNISVQSKNTPLYGRGLEPDDNTLFPSPVNEQHYGGYPINNEQNNTARQPFNVPDDADISRLTQGKEQQLFPVSRNNAPDISDAQTRHNISNSDTKRNDINSPQLASDTAGNNNNKNTPFNVPDDADISRLMGLFSDNYAPNDTSAPRNNINTDSSTENNAPILPDEQPFPVRKHEFVHNSEETLHDDFLPPEIVKTKEGNITTTAARVQRSYIPSVAQQVKKAATTGKPVTRYFFYKRGEAETSNPSNNPEKYSYDDKLTGYDGYLGDINVGIGDNSSISHVFYGQQDGNHYVGFTDNEGNFVATYDLRNNAFFINEGSETSGFARRIEDDFRRAFGKNPTEEILRRLIMHKAINAGEADTLADAASRVYMAMNENLASQSGISLLDMVAADNLSIQKINKLDSRGDRGSTKITPRTDLNGQPIFEAQNIISLFKNSDASSLLHEFWHIYQEKIKRLANSGLIKRGSNLWQDWSTILGEAGLRGTDFSQKIDSDLLAKWHNSQEKNAASFEKYFREGHPPQGISAKMRKVFDNFTSWLSNVYRKIRDIFYTDANGRRRNDFAVNDRIRKVFDHIFTGRKFFDSVQESEAGNSFSAYNDPQGFHEFRQSGLSTRTRFINWVKNLGRNFVHPFVSVAHKPSVSDNVNFTFSNPETERRFLEAAKPLQRRGIIGRINQAVRDTVSSIKGGDYALLTNSPRARELDFFSAAQAFRNLGRAKKVAVQNAMKSFSDNLRPLNPHQRELFNRFRLLQDLAWQIQEMPDSELPFGYDKDTLHADLKNITPHLTDDKAVWDAVQAEERTMREINEDFMKYSRLLGYNMDGVFRNPHYYRHRIIQYAQASRMGYRQDSSKGNIDVQGLADAELRAIMGREFFKKRKGSTLDFITDYVQANAEVRMQMMQDIETMKTLLEIKRKFDIAPRLRKQFNLDSGAQNDSYSDGEDTFFQSSTEGTQDSIFDHVPEGHEAVDLAAVGGIDSMQSAPDNLIRMAASEFSERTGIPVDKALGLFHDQDDKSLVVIPSEVADTLRDLAKKRHRGMLGQAAKDLTTWWKRSVLFTPTRNLLYNIRNFTGDLDAIIAGNPHALKYLPQAIKELTAHYINGKKEGYSASQDLQDYIRLSGNLGIQALNLSANEAQAILALAEDLQNNNNTTKTKQLWSKAKKIIPAFFAAEHSFTEWREHLLRFAAYLDYKEQMQSNENGKPNNWGASIEDEVMAVKDIKERAFKMSNELLGAYDQVSEVGKQLRDMLIPFYSWMEVNMRRTYRLLKNGFKYGYGTRQAKQLALGKAASIPFYALSAGQSVAKLLAFTAALQLFNRTVAAGDDDDLPNDVKYRPHLTLGKVNGRVLYFDRIGAIADALDWASLDSAWLDAKDFANGQKSIGAWLKQIAQAPVSKVINGLNPGIRLPIELAMGRSTFPNAFNPSTIRDPAEYIARSFGLAWPYKAFTGKPHDNAQELSHMFIYSQDVDEAAYWQTLDRVRQFQNQVLDKHFDGFASTARGRILQNIKKALRYKDNEALRRFIREYAQADGTKKGLKQSIMAMDPLHGLTEKEKAQFLRWISADDRKYLRKAQRYFHQLADRFIR